MIFAYKRHIIICQSRVIRSNNMLALEDRRKWKKQMIYEDFADALRRVYMWRNEGSIERYDSHVTFSKSYYFKQ